MSAQPQPSLTPEQYLAIERTADFRSEYYEGVMYAMSGGTHTHALIIGNLSGELSQTLKKQPLLVTASQLRVCVQPDDFFTYPDIVVCEEPKYVDGHTDTLLNPALIIEVLSPSTEGHDRGFKAGQYRKVEALQEYALVSQTEPHIEIFRRQSNGKWLMSEVSGLDAICSFDSVDCSIALAEIYDKVTLAADPSSANPAPEV